tara:strand:+ start:1463 stop:2890 length:1428 start_codon:yes stop_codon:yes gene_type:complete
MANFWAGVGQGFSGGFEKAWDAAARRRERREDREQALKDLESQREYAEDVYDKRERDKRAKEGAAASASLLMQMERNPEAKKRLLEEAIEERGIGPSPEGVEQTDFTGGRILREEGDVIGALRDMSLEKKTALSKHLELKSALYDDRVKKAIEYARVLGRQDSISGEESPLIKNMMSDFEGDPIALKAINDGYNIGGAEDKAEFGEKQREAEEKNKSAINMLEPMVGIYNKQRESDPSLPPLPPEMLKNPDLTKSFLTKNMKGLRSLTDAETKMKILSNYENKLSLAKVRLQEAINAGDNDLSEEQKDVNNSLNSLRVTVATLFSKGWELDVDEETGEVMAMKVDPETGKRGNYSIGYTTDLAGKVTAYPKIKEGLGDEEYLDAINEANNHIKQWITYGAQSPQNPDGFTPPANKASEEIQTKALRNREKTKLLKERQALIEAKKRGELVDEEIEAVNILLDSLEKRFPSLPPEE